MDGLLQFDLVIIHVDADVASMSYRDANAVPDLRDGALPCEQPCPPVSDTTDALRQVVLSWCGEVSAAPQVVICMPSKSTEAWVVAMLFPADPEVIGLGEFQCFADPALRLGQQIKRNRLRKTQRDYQEQTSRFEDEWPRISNEAGMSEARRFRADIAQALAASSI